MCNAKHWCVVNRNPTIHAGEPSSTVGLKTCYPNVSKVFHQLVLLHTVVMTWSRPQPLSAQYMIIMPFYTQRINKQTTKIECIESSAILISIWEVLGSSLILETSFPHKCILCFSSVLAPQNAKTVYIAQRRSCVFSISLFSYPTSQHYFILWG
jgi:hypothetical protein